MIVSFQGTQFEAEGPHENGLWALITPDPKNLRYSKVMAWGKLEELASDVAAACFRKCSRCGLERPWRTFENGLCLNCQLKKEEAANGETA